MVWQINQLQDDFKQNRASVGLTNQDGSNWSNVNVNFPVTDADRQTEGDAEKRLKTRAKQLLLDAANSL